MIEPYGRRVRSGNDRGRYRRRAAVAFVYRADQTSSAVRTPAVSGRGKGHLEAEERFEALLEAESVSQAELHDLLDDARELPVRSDYEYEAIRARRDPCSPSEWAASVRGGFDDLDDPYDVVYGGWLGAIAGCFLGKPVQGWSRDKIHKYLEASNQYPSRGTYGPGVSRRRVRHLQHGRVLGRIGQFIRQRRALHARRRRHRLHRCWPRNFERTRLRVRADGRGKLLASESPGVQHIHRRTDGLPESDEPRNAPDSASLRNPYREHVGALIRADMWAYVALGDPEQAAAYAWRDASISHVKTASTARCSRLR
ncbi:ADP-ribosylglycohydrolase family protein [Natrialba swarupiae]|nr:ADP-ribosylglycohydrolase family protein [Natrialba swarupiae]